MRKRSDPPCWIRQLVFILSLPAFAFAQTRSQGNYTALSDAFWQLGGLTEAPEVLGHTWNPLKGGQNFTHCCLLAVNDSLQVVNGSILNTTNWIQATVDELIIATQNDQFPCTAVWNGNPLGAYVVEVPWPWYEDHCKGWELSDSRKGDESQWIQPFVGFLLPAVVFCVTIPRRRKLAVWRKLFALDMSQVVSWLIAPFAMIVAGFCVVCDTVVWLSMCFAFACPMLLSGLYEAFLDNAIIGFLQEKTNNFRLTLDMRARLLFVILVGNLDLEPELTPGDQELQELVDHDNAILDWNPRWPNYPGNVNRNPSSPWVHIENLVHPLRTYRDMAVSTPRQWPLHDATCEIADCTNSYHKEPPLVRSAAVHKEIGRTKTRLRTMLACQYSFGSTVGAPVVFFLGAFVFTLIATTSSLGDEDTSLALAFGMWYMIIPHISIVSGLLLAGNNPNTLEGVVALEFGEVAEDGSAAEKEEHIGNRLFELAYDSRYRPQWLWLRGKSKRDWVEQVWKTYMLRPHRSKRGETEFDEDMVKLQKVTTLTFLNWVIVVGMTLLLMGLPYLLAFLTGFYTPEVGLSCRSLTFTVYAITQTCQIILWLWAYGGSPKAEGTIKFFRKGGWLDQKGFYTPTSITTLFKRGAFFSLPTLWAIIWYFLATIFGLGGVITSIGGTMMQLMGVYNSDKCNIISELWTKPKEALASITVIVSQNYALEIYEATKYWVPCAITATLFLGAVSFCGWWYQRRLRGLFRQLVGAIGDLKTDREEVRALMTPSPNL